MNKTILTRIDIENQYKELLEIVKDITTIEQIKAIYTTMNEIEVNYDTLSYYHINDPICVIRYEYKDILVYFDIKNGIPTPREKYITVYNSDGTEIFEGKIEDFVDEEY